MLFVDGGLVYAAGNGISAYDPEAGLETLVSDEPSGIQQMVRVGESLFVTAGLSWGTLSRVPLGGGEPELIDRDLGWGGLATDGRALYYDGGSVALVRCPDPGAW